MSKTDAERKATMGFAKSPAVMIRIVLCVFVALPFSQSVAGAVSSPAASNNNSQITKLKNDLEYVSKQEAAQIKEYLALKAERQKADANLVSLNKKISDAESRQAGAQAAAAAARAEFAAAQKKYDDAEDDKRIAQDRRQKAIINLYQSSSDPDALPSVLNSDPNERPEVIRKNILMQRYQHKQVDVAADAQGRAQAAIDEKLLHEDARIRAEEAEKVAAAEAASLGPLKAELTIAQRTAKKKEKDEEAIVNSLKSQKANYNKQISQLIAESNALAKQIKKNQNPATPVVPGKMIKPVNAPVTSSFGYRTHPIYGDARLHAGVDLGAGYSTAIKAAKAGKVITASVLSGYGNVIIIDHGGGISTLYAHQSSFAVSLGARVTQGQVIGYVGATGQVTGPHLHWEVRVNGAPVNPMGYL